MSHTQSPEPAVKAKRLSPLVQLLGILLALTLFGLILTPLQRIVSSPQAPALHTQMAENSLSQSIARFALGGLRSMAAQLLQLDATSAWMQKDWARLQRRYEQITTLNPERENYWANASYEMATNAVADVPRMKDLSEREQAQRKRSYYLRGLQFLEDGLRYQPDSLLLTCRLGELHGNLYRYPRFLQAARAYRRAVELGAPPVYARLEFYSLCRVHGYEAQAYALGRKLFEDDKQSRPPSMRCLLFVLQNKLNLPEDERLSITQLFGSKERARRLLASYQHNQLLYPTTGVAEYLAAKKN